MTSYPSALRSFLLHGDDARAWARYGSASAPARRQFMREARAAVEAALERRTARVPVTPGRRSVAAHVRRAVGPMVNELFPLDERDRVTTLLQRCAVVIADDNVRALVRSTPDPQVAWKVANLWLRSALGQRIGRGEDVIAFAVPRRMYLPPLDQLPGHSAVLVHEAAHVLHRTTRGSAGLRRRRRERLVRVPFSLSEVFAYSCEVVAVARAYPRLGWGYLARQVLDGAWLAQVVDVVEQCGTGRGAYQRIARACAP